MRLLHKFIVGGIYIMLSLLLGELHPFTLVPMYNSIPNYAYSFYLSDSSNHLLPLGDYYYLANDELSHKYTTICEREHIKHGDQQETMQQLQIVGNAMFGKMKEYQRKKLPAGSIRLHRVCYFLRNDSILQSDLVMFEKLQNE